MKSKPILRLILPVALLIGCVNEQSLTAEEWENQNRVASLVSAVLFANELDELASYRVHKDGFLVIKFAETVPFEQYNHVVDVLRSSEEVRGVRAEQGGREVCPISSLRQ